MWFSLVGKVVVGGYFGVGDGGGCRGDGGCPLECVIGNALVGACSNLDQGSCGVGDPSKSIQGSKGKTCCGGWVKVKCNSVSGVVVGGLHIELSPRSKAFGSNGSTTRLFGEIPGATKRAREGALT